MTIRIAQVSDAHLSPRLPLFESNFDRVAQAVRDAAPDLVVATGDSRGTGARPGSAAADCRPRTL